MRWALPRPINTSLLNVALACLTPQHGPLEPELGPLHAQAHPVPNDDAAQRFGVP
jgi:hypothetical protein